MSHCTLSVQFRLDPPGSLENVHGMTAAKRNEICKTVEAIVDAVRAKMEDSEESLRSAARETGISPTHLSQFKNNKRNLKFENLQELADHYGVKYTLKNH